MRTPAIIEGLTILQKYRDTPDGYHCGAEHDQFWAGTTDHPLDHADLSRLAELGWFQEEIDCDNTIKDYDPEEPWSCFV